MKKNYGTFGVEMRAYGQKLVKFCKHRQAHASKLVVEMMYTSLLIGDHDLNNRKDIVLAMLLQTLS